MVMTLADKKFHEQGSIKGFLFLCLYNQNIITINNYAWAE